MHRQHVDIDLGVIDSRDGNVTGYGEKPTLESDVSMGSLRLRARGGRVHCGLGFPFPELVFRLLDAGMKVAAFDSRADWYDIGELERATTALMTHPELFGP